MNTEKLKEIGAAMNAQDHRSTAMPLYMVQEKVRAYGAADWTSEIERNYDCDLYCEVCEKVLEKEGELPEQCAGDCPEECFNHFDWEWEIKTNHGVFFTGAACDEYINRRRYEFGEEVRSYAISAYWSHEMQHVLQYLSALGSQDGEPHPNYKMSS